MLNLQVTHLHKIHNDNLNLNLGHHNGIVCLSAFLVVDDMAQGKLKSSLDHEVILKYQMVQAVYYQHAYTPKRVRLFIEFLAYHLKDIT